MTHLAGKGLKRIFIVGLLMLAVGLSRAAAGDLSDVQEAGTLRHLGIVYANFNTENQAGLDMELMQRFARHLGVGYTLVETTWQDILADLTGKVVKPRGEDVEIIGEAPVRGDVIATGFTVLPWRRKVVDFSEPTFPTGVWLIANAAAPVQPIAPAGSIPADIAAVKARLSGLSVLGLKDSCLDPDLYGLDATGATVKLFPSDRNLDEMIPSVMARMADTTLMDVPVALIALETWPGQIKVVGPISRPQVMACAFAKTSTDLKTAFNAFFRDIKESGEYKQLVEKYYPSLFAYFPEFLAD